MSNILKTYNIRFKRTRMKLPSKEFFIYELVSKNQNIDWYLGSLFANVELDFEEVLAGVNQVLNSELNEYQVNGGNRVNAFVDSTDTNFLTFNDDSDFTGYDFNMPTTDFKLVVEEWLKFIS